MTDKDNESSILEERVARLNRDARTTRTVDSFYVDDVRAVLLALDEQTVRAEELERRLLGLIAVIHRDGGHYVTEHGLAAACSDAESWVLIAHHDADRGVKLDRLVRDYLDAEDAYETEDDRMALGKLVDDARMVLCVALGRGR